MSDAQLKYFRRILVVSAILIASPLYVICGGMHVCMDGHMRHAPYPFWHYLVDATWGIGFVISGVVCWKSNLRFRKTIFLLVAFLFLSRLGLGSGGGMFFILELPAVLVLVGLAVRNLFSGSPDPHELSEEQRRSRRKRIFRRWMLAGGMIVAVGFLVWAVPQCYRLIKTLTAQEVVFTNFPATREIQLAPGKACILRLPSRRTVALWCSRAWGTAAGIEGSDLGFDYGEVPFKDLRREEISLPGGGVTSGDYFSYIRQGGVTTSDKTRAYELFVDQYCLTITRELGESSLEVLPLTVSVRLATEKELIPPKKEREHYLQALHSNDAKTRLEAIHELGEMVSLGSIYAGNHQEIMEAIRPFLKDADPAVREEALVRLRVMGDDDALLAMLSPKPLPEFSEPNGAWTIAGWCRRNGSEKVPRHVLTFFDTDDAKLHEFALAFFSCYPFPASQPYVVKALKSDRPDVRAAAVSAIPSTCDQKTAVSLLYEALGDPSEKVLLQALKEAHYYNENIPLHHKLVELADQSPSEIVRRMAKQNLSERERK